MEKMSYWVNFTFNNEDGSIRADSVFKIKATPSELADYCEQLSKERINFKIESIVKL